MSDCYFALLNIDQNNIKRRRRLVKMIMRLFDQGGMPTREPAALPGLSPKSGTTNVRYRAGRPFADRKDLLGRMGHLLGVHQSLRRSFPHDIELAYRWIRNGTSGSTALPTRGYEERLRRVAGHSVLP
ncbi:hypothetical protein [Geothermobacter hydrogeniphilus]|uniref:hypothetical protein n=1 Tax=Geothermobacter hydrogeniphilus TaxID=1969733 RepID=UPI00111C2C93|nr:hypothetical protein [Geothermobacter hydrogeniphilus]